MFRNIFPTICIVSNFSEITLKTVFAHVVLVTFLRWMMTKYRLLTDVVEPVTFLQVFCCDPDRLKYVIICYIVCRPLLVNSSEGIHRGFTGKTPEERMQPVRETTIDRQHKTTRIPQGNTLPRASVITHHRLTVVFSPVGVVGYRIETSYGCSRRCWPVPSVL